jgi:predicted acylesterase/phospholipase RssA
VIHTLSRANVQIVRIIASSSGALNGSMLAAAVRRRDVQRGADALVELWRDDAEWNGVFHASFHDVLARRGVSDRAKVLELLRRLIVPSTPAVTDEINLRLLVAPLNGVIGAIGGHPATTFESVREFTSADFATPAAIERVFDAATASSAFPLVFAPVDVDDLGPCVDGGAVNNTPVKWSLDGPIGDTVEAVVVVASTVELRRGPPPELHGLGLASHLANMLIGERLYRDLHDAEQVTTALERLVALVQTGVLSPAQLESVMTALGWTGRRPVKLIQIRPVVELAGNAFAGFFDRALREQYLTAGLTRAAEVLAEAGL